MDFTKNARKEIKRTYKSGILKESSLAIIIQDTPIYSLIRLMMLIQTNTWLSNPIAPSHAPIKSDTFFAAIRLLTSKNIQINHIKL